MRTRSSWRLHILKSNSPLCNHCFIGNSSKIDIELSKYLGYPCVPFPLFIPLIVLHSCANVLQNWMRDINKCKKLASFSEIRIMLISSSIVTMQYPSIMRWKTSNCLSVAVTSAVIACNQSLAVAFVFVPLEVKLKYAATYFPTSYIKTCNIWVVLDGSYNTKIYVIIYIFICCIYHHSHYQVLCYSCREIVQQSCIFCYPTMHIQYNHGYDGFTYKYILCSFVGSSFSCAQN